MLSASLEELFCFSLLRLSVDEELELDAGVELELSTVAFLLLEEDSALALELDGSSSEELKEVSSLEEIGSSLALLGSSPQATIRPIIVKKRNSLRIMLNKIKTLAWLCQA